MRSKVRSVDKKSVRLGKIIAQARRENKLTQQKLCQLADISYSTLTKIERGAIIKPNIFLIRKIAKALNCSMEDLVSVPLSTGVVDNELKSRPKIKFIYFDLHGVLIYNNSIAGLAKTINNPIESIEHLILQHDQALVEGVLDLEQFNQILRQQLVAPGLNWPDVYVKYAIVIEEMLHVCDELMKKYPVGLMTNAYPSNVDSLLKANILPNKFKAIVDSSKAKLSKPHKAVFEYAQKEAGCRAENILLIDDRQINILAAENYGWQGFLFNQTTRVDLKERLKEIVDF